MQLDERLDNRNEIELEWLFAHRASRDQNVKRIREAQQPVDLLLKRRARIRGGGHHTVLQCLQVAVEVGPRSPQLMRKAEHRLVALALLILAARRQLVASIPHGRHAVAARPALARRRVAGGCAARRAETTTCRRLGLSPSFNRRRLTYTSMLRESITSP